MQSNINSISEFGHSFQVKLIYSLLTDTRFLEQVIEPLNTKYFENESFAWVVDTIKDHFVKYKIPPSMEALAIAVKEIPNPTLRETVKSAIKDTFKDMTDLDFVKDKTIDFCKNEALKQAIYNSVDLFKTGQHQEVRKIIDDALKVGIDSDLGHDYLEMFEHRINGSSRKTVSTGWPIIDNIVDGGLGPGEMGIVVAPAGIGKCIGANTKIDIKYNEIGVESPNGAIIWYKPWEFVESTHVREVMETVSVKKLFGELKIQNTPNEQFFPEFELSVKTPIGYKSIKSLFRTDYTNVNTLYFANGNTLECSTGHLLKVNGEWKASSEILLNCEYVETDGGVTTVKKRINKKNKKFLYDLSVSDIHCYYSNKILSHNSWLLQSTAYSAMKNGLNALYFTMELSQDYVGLRFDSLLTGIPSQNLKYHKEDVEHKLSEISGTLNIKYYPTKSASVQTLRAYIEKMKMIKGFTPDIIFVDYADLLIGAGSEKRFILENIYEDLRGVAGEFQIPLWTASQSHRASTEMDVIDGAQVSEAYSKIMIGDFIISLSRKINDKISGTARIHVIKNRMGKDGVTFPAKFNASNGQIEIYEEDSMSGKETTHKMKNGEEVVRQLLSRKFNELEGTTEGFE